MPLAIDIHANDYIMKPFTEEQRERAKECKTLKNLMRFSVEDDIELSEEALECVGDAFCIVYSFV